RGGGWPSQPPVLCTRTKVIPLFPTSRIMVRSSLTRGRQPVATMAERGAAPATRPPPMEGAGRGRTSPGQERRFRTSREAFVKLARRHYDRLPGAGPKGGARRPRKRPEQ